ncbi:hypothetical protein [Neopusillimonas maritima]|uniref:Uncharacterized protein n=1 Tax=Neopusillimonas maritima TaxID=2026239 RepID=A0A3A1YZP8_9BURK|nr:hypothetical protein [Neopusillimonas maritima]RIY41964.1 hypothetical protein CJP73_00515 [Neopusillimonas maritima]
MSKLSADDLIWNWARWCWSGETVGNMTPYVSWEDDFRPIQVDQAREVEQMHKSLSHFEAMIITAEYPQKNAMFAGLSGDARQTKARRWIFTVTGVHLSADEYRMFLGLFRDSVQRRFT